DHLPSRRIQIGRALISQEFQALDNVFEFNLNCHTYNSILCGITPLSRVGLLRKPFFCPCSEPSDPEGWVEGTLGVLGHRMSGSNLFEHLIIEGSGFPLTDGTEITTHNPSKPREFGDMKPLPMGI